METAALVKLDAVPARFDAEGRGELTKMGYRLVKGFKFHDAKRALKRLFIMPPGLGCGAHSVIHVYCKRSSER